MATHIDLAEYLFRRIRQLGVKAVHGVPGDYNLTALDYIEPADLDWVGNANELNAGYAADGYARIRGASCLITAFGVGELSAINAVAGAYAEMAPVIHIVGTPATHIQDGALCMHHSLGDGNFRLFADMAAKFSVAQANLRDAETATGSIDRCLQACILQSRPVYIELPTNMVKARVRAADLERPIDLSIPINDEGFEDTEVDLILSKMYASKQPFIVVDGFTSRYGISEEADELVRVTGFPTSTTPFGKGIVNESYPNFYGMYAGIAGQQVYVPWARGCDLVLRLGPLNSDVNTFGFSTIPDPKITVTFERDCVEIAGTKYNNLHVKALLRKVLGRLDKSKLPRYQPTMDLGDPRELLKALPPTEQNETIEHETFWQRMSNFFRPGDVILTETGTPSVGGRDFVLPPHSTLINSSIWLSIGYMLGACAGAALAQREMIAEGRRPAGRTILFEGDGSLQMTAQAFSDMIRNRLDVVVFVINNDGYTIERWIHGMRAGYNDIQPWRYLEAGNYFGAPQNDPSYPVITRRAETWGQLNAVLAEPEIRRGKGLCMVEVMMTKEDAPDVLKKLVENVSRRGSGESLERPNKAITHEEKVMKIAG
jgi:pyruvate decarboxylase